MTQAPAVVIGTLRVSADPVRETVAPGLDSPTMGQKHDKVKFW